MRSKRKKKKKTPCVYISVKTVVTQNQNWECRGGSGRNSHIKGNLFADRMRILKLRITFLSFFFFSIFIFIFIFILPGWRDGGDVGKDHLICLIYL